MPCSVTYEFRVIRWANSGSSCARGFRPHARQGEREEDGRGRERNGHRGDERRAEGRQRERIKRAKRQGRVADAREQSGKSPCGGGPPPGGYSGRGGRGRWSRCSRRGRRAKRGFKLPRFISINTAVVTVCAAGAGGGRGRTNSRRGRRARIMKTSLKI